MLRNAYDTLTQVLYILKMPVRKLSHPEKTVAMTSGIFRDVR